MSRQSIEDRILAREQAAADDPADAHDEREDGSVMRKAMLSLIGLVLVGGLGAGAYFAMNRGFLNPSVAQTPPAKTDQSPNASPFLAQADQAGITTCRDVFLQLGAAITLGATYAVRTEWAESSPGSRAVQSVVGLNYDTPNYKGQAGGVILASPQGKACAGTMVRVTPMQQNCQQVVSSFPAGSERLADLSGATLFQLGNNAGQALVVPSSESCVVVSLARMSTAG